MYMYMLTPCSVVTLSILVVADENLCILYMYMYILYMYIIYMYILYM